METSLRSFSTIFVSSSVFGDASLQSSTAQKVNNISSICQNYWRLWGAIKYYRKAKNKSVCHGWYFFAHHIHFGWLPGFSSDLRRPPLPTFWASSFMCRPTKPLFLTAGLAERTFMMWLWLVTTTHNSDTTHIVLGRMGIIVSLRKIYDT